MVKREENEDNICHWEECLLQYDTADDLFNHICAAHIGRKSAGTLSLECKWTGCRAKASKRDHLTSHCRVHVALKPHVCSICTKAFKRPQDLKKHEKIHTEEHQAQHQRVSKAAAAGMNGNPPAGKLGAQARGSTNQGATASTAPTMPQLPAQYPFSFPALGFGYPGLPQANGQPQQAHIAQQPHANTASHQSQQQQPGAAAATPFPVAGANADQLAQFIALQQQLNSQAQMAAATGLSLPSQAIPGLQANLTNAFAMQLNQMLGGQAMQYLQGVPMMYPYGNFGYGAGGAPFPQQQQQQHQQPQVNGSHAPQSSGMPVPAMPPMSHASSQPQGPSSLYPTLPPSLYGSSMPPPVPAVSAQQHQQYHSPSVPPMHHSVKPEEHPSPASSSRSRDSGSYSSSLSPRNLPALSPASSLTPENSFSPTPGPEQQLHKLQSDNRVVGKKRGFEEATGQLLSNLSNKRFQDQDAVNAQLDSLSTFLLTPDTQHHSLPPYGFGAHQNNDDSASSAGSDHGSTGPRFEHEDVDAINQLLLSLNQSLDSEIATSAPQLGDYHSMPGPTSHGVQTSQSASAAASYAAHAPMGASLYPSLPSGLSFAPMYGQPGMPNAYDPSSMSQHAKSVPAPSLAHDYRPTQYHHVTRLQRAAPSSSAPPQIEPGMEIDDDVKDAAEALLLAGSINRAQSVPSSKPSLPSLSTAVGSPVDERVRLPPIARISGSSSRLPPIRDLLSLRPTENVESPTSPVASTSSASSASATPPLYPSLSSIAASGASNSRPVSAGGVERLTHRVHKLRLPSTSSSGDEPAGSVREDDADLSASSGEEDEDRPTLFKKSRVESPMALSPSPEISDRESATPEPSAVKKEEDDDDDDLAEVKDELDEPLDKEDELARQEREAHINTIARRKAVIAYLAMYVNHKYREQLARKSMAQVRKAIKKPSPLSQESQSVKAEN